VRNRLITRT